MVLFVNSACVLGVSGLPREALGADPVLGPGPPLPAPAQAKPLPHGALRAPLPARGPPPQLPHPATRRLPGERIRETMEIMNDESIMRCIADCCVVPCLFLPMSM